MVIGVTVARNGEINHAPTAEALGLAHVVIAPAAPAAPEPAEVKENA